MKQVIVDSEAENELSDSVAFYEHRQPGLGLELERAARERFKRSKPARNVTRCEKTERQRLVMERFPFVIHYVELPSAIWILAFAHTSRRPGYWHRRL